jgi:hypothetical protein
MIGIGRLSTLLKAAIAALIYISSKKREKKTQIIKLSFQMIISLAEAKLSMHVSETYKPQEVP